MDDTDVISANVNKNGSVSIYNRHTEGHATPPEGTSSLSTTSIMNPSPCIIVVIKLRLTPAYLNLKH
jgi:hypothetical protein